MGYRSAIVTFQEFPHHEPEIQGALPGRFPVVPTIFDAQGELDLPGQLRCVDFMIDAGSNGLCILANFSEQFSLSDDERETLTTAILDHVAGRVPVIVTTTHYGTRICAERSRRAQQAGASMVMVMPPYHGATIRVGEAGIRALLRGGVGRHRHPDHDPGRAGQRHRAAGGAAGADGARDRATSPISRSRRRRPRPSCAS